MKLGLKEKVAVVTGGGRGIGEAIALAFAGEGTYVVVSDIDMENAKSVSKKIVEMGSKAIPVQADVSQRGEAAKIVKTAVRDFGRLDVLVNNAGI
jgi:NAD(P)-dependent dehydrogenase (short-subunit alcohol dehydrogenase family)